EGLALSGEGRRGAVTAQGDTQRLRGHDDSAHVQRGKRQAQASTLFAHDVRCGNPDIHLQVGGGRTADTHLVFIEVDHGAFRLPRYRERRDVLAYVVPGRLGEYDEEFRMTSIAHPALLSLNAPAV